MPRNERETHPFLNYLHGKDKMDWSHYKKMIVGTFTVYPITHSKSTEQEGIQKKAQWSEEANFQFFYGSKENEFWQLISNAVNEPLPQTTSECIALLERKQTMITDTIQKCTRIGYSASDTDLKDIQLNTGIVDLLLRTHKVEVIYFTSELAKRHFCQILGIQYNLVLIEEVLTKARNFTLITLPSPSPNGNRVLPKGYSTFNKWLFLKNNGRITPESWMNYFNFRGQGKLKHFSDLHGFPGSYPHTSLFKEHIYFLAFNEQFDALYETMQCVLPG